MSENRNLPTLTNSIDPSKIQPYATFHCLQKYSFMGFPEYKGLIGSDTRKLSLGCANNKGEDQPAQPPILKWCPFNFNFNLKASTPVSSRISECIRVFYKRHSTEGGQWPGMTHYLLAPNTK